MRLPPRLIPMLPLLLAACGSDPAANTSVDINAAAEQAQKSIDNYADATATPTPTPTPTPAPSPAATSSIVMPSPGPTPSEAPLDPPAPGTPGGLPDDRTPISEAPFTPDSAQGAADVVQTYYALLGEKKYGQAWALWGYGGKDSGMSRQAFAASFEDKYREYHANVGAPGRIDPGMSQRFVTVPVQVYGRLKNGTPVYMLGTVTLHRIVPGVGEDKAAEKWHIRSTDIKPRPRG